MAGVTFPIGYQRIWRNHGDSVVRPSRNVENLIRCFVLRMLTDYGVEQRAYILE